MKKIYIIQDSEAGNFIDKFDTYEEALSELMEYEKDDIENEEYEPDFYEIVEVNADEFCN